MSQKPDEYMVIVQSKEDQNLWFQLVRVNPETKKAVLRNQGGVEFEEDLTPDRLDRLGYVVRKVKVEDEELEPESYEDDA